MRGSEPSRPSLITDRVALPPGLPGVWTTALATVLVLVMLGMLLWIVVVNAFAWFWPAAVCRVVETDGAEHVGIVVGHEEAPARAGGGRELRLQLKVGNRDLDGRDFLWLDERDIAAIDRPQSLVRVVRAEYGDAFGEIVGAVGPDGSPIAADDEALGRLLADGARWRAERRRLEDRLAEARRPLTRLEEELDLRERSVRADTEEGRAAIAALELAAGELASQLGPTLDGIERELARVVEDLVTARLAISAGDRDLEVTMDQVVEVSWPNRMGLPAKIATALRQGVTFLLSEPREANTEGGIAPALFGTVLLVLLMSVAVVPLGVVTAVYMTEYARPGLLLRLANQAVNNLAGVPSIVFGMFGLAFFIYGVGGAVDRTFFSDRLPTPTFGTGGLLWAALTLALLTVPVVVVATREGLLAVPRSWRDGSLALGATQWQTLRRIVLPAAMPGILTGLILAVSRAAGEVAPLMLTGAVKLAPSLPVDATFPFLHLQRKFMHLGFHIYDVSMQSPNVEAAKPMAFATTLALLLLVVLMNLAAIVIRRRLRRAYRGQTV
ncbi:MAG: phosphate ABC transporter permease PstA [Thermoanaerobaculales bacterium]|jgi:phosphate transport system permease protein|nr:phosphate ABC transporter permease PstA [Thermoanaerobaculales bacterium]